MIEEEKERVRVLGQAHLRRSNVREQRHRDPIVAPAERFAEGPQETDRSLPSIAGHVGRPHRGRAVLKHDEIDARRPQYGNFGGGPREREDREGAGDDQAKPEHETAEDREPLAHRQTPMLPVAAGIAPPRRELPHPDHDQHRRRNQQPEVLRLGEPYGI